MKFFLPFKGFNVLSVCLSLCRLLRKEPSLMKSLLKLLKLSPPGCCQITCSTFSNREAAKKPKCAKVAIAELKENGQDFIKTDNFI